MTYPNLLSKIRTCTNPRFPISKDMLNVWGLDYNKTITNIYLTMILENT